MAPTLKILHINTYDQGGAAIAAIRLHKALLSEGVDSSILFLERTKRNIPNSYYYIDYAKTNRRFFRRQIHKLRKIIWPESEKKYLNRIKLNNRVEGFDFFSFNPCDPDISTQEICLQADVIHLHWTAGFVDYKTLKKIEKPVVWTLHDMNPFTGGCHYSSNCEKFINECRNCPQLEGTINPNSALADQNYKEQYLHGLSAVITAPSGWMGNLSSVSRLFRKFKTIHIPNSIDIEIFKPREKDFCRNVFDLPSDKRIILFISENTADLRKGFNLLVEALNLINRQDLHLCAIGENRQPTPHKQAISYLGNMYDERLISLAYSAADVVILPSLEDNLPNVMLESLACGTPIIAFPTGGIKETITPGSNGLLAKEINSDSLAETIKEFFDGNYLFDHYDISRAAQNIFAPSKQAIEYFAIYKELINL